MKATSRQAVVSEMGELVPWSELPIGARFKFPLPLRCVFFKTGPDTYGLSPNEPFWTWGDIYPPGQMVLTA